MTVLIRAYASIFLNFPHRTTRNYKALLKSIGNEIFHKDHKLEMYYVSAYAHYKLEFFFRNQLIDASLKPARYHMLYLFRLLTTNVAIPKPNSNEMTKYCQMLMEALWDENLSKERFQKAADIVKQAANGDLHRDNIRTEPFTEAVKSLVSL